MMYYTDSFGASASVTIRTAGVMDGDALRRIAQRDSRPVPEGELLIAEVDGEARAAIELSTGEVIADPFRPTAELVRMLSIRRSQLQGEIRPPHRRAADSTSAPRLSPPTRRYDSPPLPE
jgi:hypothetical protein